MCGPMHFPLLIWVPSTVLRYALPENSIFSFVSHFTFSVKGDFNIRALCDIAQSTKTGDARKYIGTKGRFAKFAGPVSNCRAAEVAPSSKGDLQQSPTFKDVNTYSL